MCLRSCAVDDADGADGDPCNDADQTTDEDEAISFQKLPRDAGAETVPLKDVRAAMGEDREEWKAAMEDEVQALYRKDAVHECPEELLTQAQRQKNLPMKAVATLKPGVQGPDGTIGKKRKHPGMRLRELLGQSPGCHIVHCKRGHH